MSGVEPAVEFIPGFVAMLEESYKADKDFTYPKSRLAFLGSGIFDYTTYDDEMDELFARKALEVCVAISNGTTFDYIKDKQDYCWYLWLLNTAFFEGKIMWGTSIRGAWWWGSTDGDIDLVSLSIFNKGEQVCHMVFTEAKWLAFIEAMLIFAAKDEKETDSDPVQ